MNILFLSYSHHRFQLVLDLHSRALPADSDCNHTPGSFRTRDEVRSHDELVRAVADYLVWLNKAVESREIDAVSLATLTHYFIVSSFS